jgi:hypothetical protein
MFATSYFKRYKIYGSHINSPINPNLFYSIIIPCYREPKVLETIKSVFDCEFDGFSIEIIVVVNSSVNTIHDDIVYNRKTTEDLIEFARKNNTEKIKLLVVNYEQLPKKHAGAGLARKIGMDEALFRFNSINQDMGVVVSLDADTIVKSNYISEIHNNFNDKNVEVAIIDFQHALEGNLPFDNYQSVTKYELYLRYYVNAMRFSNFPYSYYTVGSAFCFRASLYAKQGGMNKKQAGEDFYFLHKLFPVANTIEINSTTVMPSSRVSDRVPFGTGVMIEKLINQHSAYLTYSLEAFKDVKVLIDNLDKIYEKKSFAYIKQILSDVLFTFLEDNKFEREFVNILQQSPSLRIFKQRFYQWFNAFRYFKFLNDSHNENGYEKKELLNQSRELSRIIYGEDFENYFDQLKLYRSRV